MSFYSYKNANPGCCPGAISGNALDGLDEKVCIQVQRVYDSCLQQQQLTNVDVTITSYAQVVTTGCGCNAETEEAPPTSTPVPPITFESCRSSSMDVDISNLSVERLCDRPCFARVRGSLQIPIDILFTDSRCVEYIGKGTVTVNRDVLLAVPDDSIVPFNLEGMASAVCVAGTYRGNNVFRLTVCVTVVLKVLARVEILVPSYGFCTIPPCEEFADSVCDEFFQPAPVPARDAVRQRKLRQPGHSPQRHQQRLLQQLRQHLLLLRQPVKTSPGKDESIAFPPFLFRPNCVNNPQLLWINWYSMQKSLTARQMTV